MLWLSRVGAPSLSVPRLLFDAAQGALRFVAIRVLQRRQARPVDGLGLIVRAFDTRQIPAIDFKLINTCLLFMLVLGHTLRREFHRRNAGLDGPKKHLSDGCATSKARSNPHAGACPSASPSVKKVYSYPLRSDRFLVR